MLDWQQHPHRRHNPLTGEWVLVSPHRTDRPWQGQVEESVRTSGLAYDPSCYLCPGNPRAGGVHNPAYDGTFVFDNDFAALRANTPASRYDEAGLLVAESESGVCRVVCFSPRHDLTMARMEVPAIGQVIDTWTRQYAELSALPYVSSVQIFENRGAMVGASNPHPHCQIWANQSIPNEIVKEQAALCAYFAINQSCLLCDYIAIERKAGERLVVENEAFVALVPFWAVWPFETMVVSKRHRTGLDQLDDAERAGLAEILKRLTTRYDNLFQTSFPYSMGFHQRPSGESHLHVHFYPPLLRSATVRKFMVGYELLAMPQRDITAETAAGRLRETPETAP